MWLNHLLRGAHSVMHICLYLKRFLLGRSVRHMLLSFVLCWVANPAGICVYIVLASFTFHAGCFFLCLGLAILCFLICASLFFPFSVFEYGISDIGGFTWDGGWGRSREGCRGGQHFEGRHEESKAWKSKAQSEGCRKESFIKQAVVGGGLS
jgi:hypothetical protein